MTSIPTSYGKKVLVKSAPCIHSISTPLGFIRNKRFFFSDFKIVCYYGGWSVYRESPMAFGPENIDPFMCTHLIYSFTGLEGNKMVTLDNEADVVQGGYQKALDLKKVNPDLKVISKSNSS